VRVTVDPERCQGHNRCQVLVPEVFEVDELGYSVVITADVPEHLVARVLEAARNCPERAISTDLAPGDGSDSDA
jgi:ferredoxin